MSKRSVFNKILEGEVNTAYRILVVEDDEALSRLIRNNLQRAGFRAETASNGVEAIARIADNPPELLLLDYRLPDMTGKQVIEVLAEQQHSVPFIVITGHGDEKVAVEMMKLGARDYLVKDVALLDLLPSVAKQVFKQLALEKQLAESEKALRESEGRLRSYLESSPDGIYVHDLNGVFLYVNSAAERIMGYTKEELIGRALRKLPVLLPEYWSKARALQESSCYGRPAGPVEFELVRKGGSRVFIEVSTYPIVRGDRTEVISIARDVTERKQAENALRESEDRFRRLVEDMNDGYIVVQDSKVAFANARSATMFGYTLDEVVGKSAQKLLSPRVLEEVVEKHRRRLLGEAVPQQYDITIAKKDGMECAVEFSVRLIDYAGKPAVSIVIRDITERKMIEEALRQSERNYKVLFESTLDGMFVIDAETMKVVLANQIGVRIGGFDSPEEVLGLNLVDYIHPDEKERAVKVIAEDMFGRDLHQINEFRIKTRNGAERWIGAVGTRTEYQGRLAGLVSIRDITERKKAEEDKQKLEQQLHLASRLAAVGELAAGVAHELNNPLAAIQGFAQFLTAKNGLDDATKKDVETIYREAQRASRITQNLLSFARKHEPERHLISINDAVEKTLELRAHQMKVNNVELSLELEPDLPMTMADFYQMQQVFMNIIVNAEQAMLEAHRKGKLVIKTKKVGGMIQTTFTDDGPGISDENLKRIFDPFFTTKEVGKGTGLGLSICYGLVEGHGGRIYAKSKLDKGTTFVVEIPIISEDKLV